MAGANFIQHIERFVEAATSGLLEYCYASFKTSSKKDSGKEEKDLVPNAFKKAVEENNIRGMRIMLKNSLLVDHTFTEADGMLNYAKDVSELFDDQNDKHMDILNDSSKCDDNYMNGVMVDIIHNFTHERWEHLKKVVRKLHPANK